MHTTRRPRARRILLACAALAAVAGAACGGGTSTGSDSSAGSDSPAGSAADANANADADAGGDTGGQPAAVAIKTFAFAPDPVRVAAGSTVRWANQDEILHTVTSVDGAFDERLDGRGTQATVTFDRAGTYAYRCSIHPGMDGTVEVS
jgi:plastocyanin